MDIDPTYMKVFKCLVCKTCQNEHPEKYSLLTKTECKEVSPQICQALGPGLHVIRITY